MWRTHGDVDVEEEEDRVGGHTKGEKSKKIRRRRERERERILCTRR